MRDVHDHRHRREVARDAEHVDHAVFAEAHDRAAIGGLETPLLRSSSSQKSYATSSSSLMPEGRRPSASAAIVSSEMPALRPRGTWTNHSKCCVHSLETASMTSSLIRGSSELWNRRYSPTLCSRSMSSGLRRSGTKGPFTPLRGPAIISSTALRCASVISPAGSGGIRCWKASCPTTHFDSLMYGLLVQQQERAQDEHRGGENQRRRKPSR